MTILAFVCSVVIFGGDRSANAGSYYASDGTRTKDFTIFKVGDTWHLIGIHAYYNPDPAGPGSPGLIHSTSKDLILWNDIGPAIPVGPTGAWDSYDVWAPATVQTQGVYHLWYAGVKLSNNHLIQQIGHATSPDGTTWTKDSGNPVVDCSTVSWVYWDPNTNGYNTECRDPYVTWDAEHNQWLMFYTTRAKTINQDPLTGIANPAIVGLLTSPDLTTWSDAGYIFTTGGYTAESPHVFQHNGTWWLVWTGNCAWRSSKCLKYATAPSITGPYTGYTDLPAVGGDEYASEYFTDEAGTEYFGRVGSGGGWLDFERLTWPNNVFTLSPTSTAQVSGRVWIDENSNGKIDSWENGSSDLVVNLFVDNGDGQFDPNTDTVFMSTQTGMTGTRAHPVYGTYRIPISFFFGELPSTTMWVQVEPDTLDYGTPPLTGFSPTTPTVIKFVNTGDTKVTDANFGYNGLDQTPPAAVTDLSGL